ncbi:HAD family hydrolase [Allosphingosinicella indica]|uniref:HAD family hydrolase n=1 Tax=Allosphingosinicella indica TaxID=941907 RepID=A0A1X7GP37_9SPHN|nr:HAD family hydrolase [Allosphingosinicella indica]SMF72587.1 hypothetical protein SAMN06295910_2041 [Allosphingosinicella indica]
MKTSVRAHQIAGLLDQAPEGVRVLSLDCFDTLLWRNTHAPHDVFADLELEGGAVWPRMRAENRARRASRVSAQGEVTIEDIYRQMWPSADEAAITAAIDTELDAEARHCFGFAPTADLIRAAKAKGMQIVVVSDTYLNEPQLRTLIGRAAGDEVAGLIDRIFCSCEYGVNKHDGLFEHVLGALGVPGEAVLHVGDNKAADQDGPEPFGVHTAHLVQFDAECVQRLRMEAAAASLIDDRIRSTAPAYQPHRAQIALRENDDPVWALGHDVLGPVMHAFAAWVKDEAAEMAERTGKPVKLLFLLRDGYLPQRVFEAAFGAAGAAVEISRFTARKASFDGPAAITNFLTGQNDHGRLDILGRQMLLSNVEAMKLCDNRGGKAGQRLFAKNALHPRNVAKVVERSSAFAERLCAHVRNVGGVEDGDAVMLVDLGYNGTVQNMIQPVLEERMNLTVAGRYLLLREESFSGLDKKGFFDQRHYDHRVLHALSGPIAVIEQICTIEQGSVVDYAPDGEARRKASDVKGGQNDTRDRIQEACVAFAGEVGAGFLTAPKSDDAECRRAMAGAILARLLFLPTASEVELFQRFHHDVNLGTSDLVQMLDIDASTSGLRRRGPSYLNDAYRIYLPGELQPHGLPLNLALFSVQRFGIDLRTSDFQVGQVSFPAFVADNKSQTTIRVSAHPTHDGYYLATVPVGAGRFAVGIQLGALCEWVQIDEVGFYPVDGFIPQKEGERATMLPAEVVRDGMHEQASGLFRCDAGALMLTPPPAKVSEPHLLSIVFRPLVWREVAEMKQAA